ncbi:MAG: cobalamin-dependent protein [Alphaproteobacteria bacterium]|nr:cobalamin-dependent protein [Alphaproteobacteria bacterium]
MRYFHRDTILPEKDLPSAKEIVAEGVAHAGVVSIGNSAFLREQAVRCEADFKQREARLGRIMQHAQIGYRSLERSIEAAQTIYTDVAAAGYRVDRYGICLDWSMGYPKAERAGRPKGTGLILSDGDDFARLANAAPVAPHFGDFVIGMPSALENTAAALRAGSTSIGNLGQYFTFELPGWNDDVATTRATVAAIALASAQPETVLIHSNIDDGFAARFADLASALGAVMLEIYIVDDLLGGHASHCYGHTFSGPLARFAFQRALGRISRSPGTMVYGNTTGFGANEAANYAALGAYLMVDIQAQLAGPTGHAINPVPITEALRIPDIDEVVAAQTFCGQMVQRSQGMECLIDTTQADFLADRMIEGAERFKAAVLVGLEDAGIDTSDPFELFLSLRRIGAKRLEQAFGPGREEVSAPNGRRPIEPSPVLAEISDRAAEALSGLSAADRAGFAQSGLRVVTATTDVHEYGKRLLEEIFSELGIEALDGGVSTDPDELAKVARDCDAIFLSTYNGVALSFLKALKAELAALDLDIPVFVGGKLNEVPADSNTNLPVDVSGEMEAEGAFVCRSVEDLYGPLATLAASVEGRM